MTQLLNQIAELSVEEKIILVERIWDDIAQSAQAGKIKISKELKAELTRRYQLVKEGKTNLYSWEEAEKLILSDNPAF